MEESPDADINKFMSWDVNPINGEKLDTPQKKADNMMVHLGYVLGQGSEYNQVKDDLAALLIRYITLHEQKMSLDLSKNEDVDTFRELAPKMTKIEDDFRAKFLKAQPESYFRPNTRPQNLVLKNPYVIDMEGRSYADIHGAEGVGLTNHILDAKAHGNDGVIFLNLVDPGFPDTHIAIFKGNEHQIEEGLAPSKPLDWSQPQVDVSWKTTPDELSKAAVDFSKPMETKVKFEEGALVDNIDTTKPKGVADAELDRMDLELAKANMTEAEAKAFDEQIKALDDEMASDDRVLKATEAVIKCRTK